MYGDVYQFCFFASQVKFSLMMDTCCLPKSFEVYYWLHSQLFISCAFYTYILYHITIIIITIKEF